MGVQLINELTSPVPLIHFPPEGGTENRKSRSIRKRQKERKMEQKKLMDMAAALFIVGPNVRHYSERLQEGEEGWGET